jgi:hypothetical protein
MAAERDHLPEQFTNPGAFVHGFLFSRGVNLPTGFPFENYDAQSLPPNAPEGFS